MNRQSETPVTSLLGLEENTTTIEVLHNCAPFIAKLYSLVNSPKTNHLIQWSEAHKGTAICVVDSVQFSLEILPKHFKHSNIASFVRQLNIYGFHKMDSKDGLCFKHEFFQKDAPELLEKIKRKKNKKTTIQSQTNQSVSNTTQPSQSNVNSLNNLNTVNPPLNSLPSQNVTQTQSMQQINETQKQQITHTNSDYMSVFALRYDLNKLQNQVEMMKAELDESKMKWGSLSRKIDSLDQIFNLIYSSNYSNVQNNSQMNQNQSGGYFNNPLSMYSGQRRTSDFQNDQSRHRDQP